MAKLYERKIFRKHITSINKKPVSQFSKTGFCFNFFSDYCGNLFTIPLIVK